MRDIMAVSNCALSDWHSMHETLEIHPSGPVDARIKPPGSKSITNRALVCAALAEGVSRLTGALDSDDTRVMIAALGQLGIDVEHDREQSTLRVHGSGGRLPAQQADLWVGNSGTTIRFLAALVATGQGDYRLDGIERMRQRPIGDLLDALKQLGGDATSELENGCPPVRVHARGLRGGKSEVAGDISSQFLSALLMAAPAATAPVEIAVRGLLVSKPYVAMTRRVMESFGVTIDASVDHRFLIPAPMTYRACDYAIEPDASAASYFFAAAAITGGKITVEGLSQESLQGDVAFCDCLERMGCHVTYGPNQIEIVGDTLRGIQIDMNAISDTVQTLAAVALFADSPTTITNVGHIRHKETDRIAALATELRKLGAAVEERSDGLTISPAKLHGAEIETYDDHRMAMSLALVGLTVPGLVIGDPGCTAKTYPRFFEDLARISRYG